jgi:hypothetical protein
MKLSENTSSFLTRVSGKVVYGAIVLEALLGALSDPLPGSPTVMLSLALSLVVVVLAGGYADWVGESMEARTLASWGERLKELAPQLRQRSWVLAPLLVPLAFFGLAMVGVLSQRDAYALTRVVLLGVLFFFGFAAARLSGAGVVESVMHALVITLLGYVVVQAKILVKVVGALGT